MPYLTPDSQESDLLFTIIVPDDRFFVAALNGAILVLAHDHNWEQYNALTPEEAAEIMQAAWDRRQWLQGVLLDDTGEPLTDATGDYLRE